MEAQGEGTRERPTADEAITEPGHSNPKAETSNDRENSTGPPFEIPPKTSERMTRNQDSGTQRSLTDKFGKIAKVTVTGPREDGVEVQLEDGSTGFIQPSQLAERPGPSGETELKIGDEIFAFIVGVDSSGLTLSQKMADNELGQDPESTEFDPTLYGMEAQYDEQGNYIYPQGFDPEMNDWAPGFEKQRAGWEQEYAEAQKKFERHRFQVIARRSPPTLKGRRW
ncbi:S1 RNA-binding domain-containing protein [Streptomyces longwoodensis]